MPEPARERIAREALLEIARPADVGDRLETESTDDVIRVRFAATMGGYRGWHWAVTMSELPGEHPSVLELALEPGEGALLAPDWIPWADRLEEYRAAQAAAGLDPDEAGDEHDDDDDQDDDDQDDVDVDIDEGIDFESAELTALDDSGLPAMGVEEQDEAQAEPDEDRPE